jgi:hypothetical protein
MPFQAQVSCIPRAPGFASSAPCSLGCRECPRAGIRSIRGPGLPEIDQLKRASTLEYHVVRFDVAMDDAAPVKRRQGLRDPDRDNPSFLQTDPTACRPPAHTAGRRTYRVSWRLACHQRRNSAATPDRRSLMGRPGTTLSSITLSVSSARRGSLVTASVSAPLLADGRRSIIS